MKNLYIYIYNIYKNQSHKLKSLSYNTFTIINLLALSQKERKKLDNRIKKNSLQDLFHFKIQFKMFGELYKLQKQICSDPTPTKRKKGEKKTASNIIFKNSILEKSCGTSDPSNKREIRVENRGGRNPLIRTYAWTRQGFLSPCQISPSYYILPHYSIRLMQFSFGQVSTMLPPVPACACTRYVVWRAQYVTRETGARARASTERGVVCIIRTLVQMKAGFLVMYSL